MQDEYIEIKSETIGIAEQRNLIEMTNNLGRLMTKEEYICVMLAFQKTIDRLIKEAKNQGVEI